jgi:hypothetical protein
VSNKNEKDVEHIIIIIIVAMEIIPIDSCLPCCCINIIIIINTRSK